MERIMLAVILFLITILVVFFLLFYRRSKGRVLRRPVDNKQIQELIAQIRVTPGVTGQYDRKDWEGYCSYYYCGNRFSSIRTYDYYASAWNNGYNYTCPYTGEKVYSADELDYDYIIPLGYVCAHGGFTWSNAQKVQFANDVQNGVDVNMSANRAKGDAGPSRFLPQINKAMYCYTWLVIAHKYNLTIDPDDMYTIKKVLMHVTSIQPINLLREDAYFTKW